MILLRGCELVDVYSRWRGVYMLFQVQLWVSKEYILLSKVVNPVWPDCEMI